MPRDNGLDGTYLRREKQKKEKSVKVAKSNEKVNNKTFHFDAVKLQSTRLSLVTVLLLQDVLT